MVEPLTTVTKLIYKKIQISGLQKLKFVLAERDLAKQETTTLAPNKIN